MPVDSGRPSLSIIGSLRVSCGGFHFRVSLGDERWIAEFPSFAALLLARTEAESLRKAISSLPSLPPRPGKKVREPVSSNPNLRKKLLIWVQVGDRPVGKLSEESGSLKFHPTPLRFFTKHK